MERLKNFVFKHFEEILVLTISLIVVSASFFIFQQLAFLNFYYLPVL
ncbi:MAG: hypothetical protein GTO24_12320, partial [candidate division Zixibacteria bacterium]|nr:hypothetical protein [candidate division Zixibacteria bacterium]